MGIKSWILPFIRAVLTVLLLSQVQKEAGHWTALALLLVVLRFEHLPIEITKTCSQMIMRSVEIIVGKK